MKVAALDDWRAGVALQQVRFHAPILVAKQTRLLGEWQAQIVDGRVAAISRYKPKWERGAPAEVIAFAERVHHATTFEPRAYTMDVAQTERGLAVVEVGCLLCTGFYESDPAAIVEAVAAIVRTSASEA